MFKGREKEIQDISALLRDAEEPGVGIAIYGQKRVGKTSMRERISQQLELDDRLVIADLDSLGSVTPASSPDGSTRLIATLLFEILHRIHKRRHQDALFKPDREKFIANDQPVLEFIHKVEEWLEDNPTLRLVVLIDEFQFFDSWIRTGALHPSFMHALKALIERRLFHLVIIGQNAVARIIKEHANVFGVFKRVHVTYLEADDARKLIIEPILLNGGSRYREQAVDRILELTGCSAFYIQKFCYRLVDHMNSERANLVTEADVEVIREKMLESLSDEDFENLEASGYTDPGSPERGDYQQALLALAKASQEGTAPFDRIKSFYDGESGQLKDLLKDLVDRKVIRQESASYSIIVRLYQDWLLRQFSDMSLRQPG